MHEEQHNILKNRKDHGYTGINQRSKVRYIRKGIKTTGLNSVNTCILLDKGLRHDFDIWVTLNKDFVEKSIVDTRQLLDVAASSSNNSSGGKGVFCLRKDNTTPTSGMR